MFTLEESLMDRLALEAEVKEIFDDLTIVACIYAVVEAGSSFVLKKIDVDSGFQTIIRDTFIKKIKESILFDVDTSVQKLTLCDVRRNVIGEVDVELGEQFKCFNSLDNNHGSSLPVFDNKIDLDSLKGLVIDIGSQAHQLLIYKHIYPIEILRTSRLAGIFNSNRLVKVDDSLLTISTTFQMIRIKGNTYVFDIDFIERNANYQLVIKAKATQACSVISDVSWIYNPQAMTDLVDDISFARKLSRISSESAVIKKSIPNHKIIDFCKTYPALKNKIRFNEDESKIILDTKVSKNLVIKIFLDDMLTSDLTESHYESLAKDVVD